MVSIRVLLTLPFFSYSAGECQNSHGLFFLSTFIRQACGPNAIIVAFFSFTGNGKCEEELEELKGQYQNQAVAMQGVRKKCLPGS